MNTLEVLQREYGICSKDDWIGTIRTTGIQQCTVWSGFDRKSGVTFLCHFDYPWSARSVPKILEELKELAGPSAKFKSVLIGGRTCRFLWSTKTRNRIKSYIDPSSDFLVVRDGPFSPGIASKGRCVSTWNGKNSYCSPSREVRKGSKVILFDWCHTLAAWKPIKRVPNPRINADGK